VHSGPEPPIVVRDVTKRYGHVRAVDRLSFDVPQGSITGFLGPNGAGKTTMLRILGGLVRPTNGRATLSGIDARRPSARRRLGYMPADPAFLAQLSGTANLDLLARLRGSTDKRVRADIAAAVGLPAADLDRPVGHYSSGMRQKLAIVAALQHRPEIVLLDEPANRLDPLAHRAFCRALRTVADDGAAVLLSSHVLAEVEAVCDSVLLVREGQLLKSARVDDLRAHAERLVTVTYVRPPARAPDMLGDPVVDECTVVGRLPAGRPDLVRRLLDEPDLRDITVAPLSLEEVVLDLYAGGQR
jgi:ABC-2 type transport system ATP-binding protein